MVKKIVALLLSVCLLAAALPGTALAAGLPFRDVPAGSWYYEAVQFVSENGIMNGTGTNTFSPNSATTRGMIVTILYRMEGEPSYSQKSSFTDAQTNYYADAVSWAAENQIVNGLSETKFGPNNNITREQMARILYNYAQFKGYDVSKQANLNGFGDQRKVNSWARTELSWAVAMELVNGTGGNLDPQGNAVRSQAATIFMRFIEKMVQDTPDSYKVTFNLGYDGASAPVVKSVASGQPVSAPDSPTREGYVFQGWFTAPTGGEKYVFDKAVNGDLQLYAQWKEAVTCKVSFNLNYPGADTVFHEEDVVAGNTCPPMADPKRNDFIFDGWFTEKTDGEKFDFTVPIMENVVLYAHWTYDGINYAEPYNATGTITVYNFKPDGESSTFSMMGRKYNQGFITAAYLASTEANAAYSLRGEYDLITFEVGHVDDGEYRDNGTLVVIADGEEIGSVELTANMPTYACAVNVKGVTQLQLVRRGGKQYYYGVGNVIQYTSADVLESGLTVPEIFTSAVVQNTSLEEGYILPYQVSGPGATVYNDLVERQTSFQMMGVKFYQGVTTGAELASSASEYLFNLGGSFDTVTFTVGAVDNNRSDENSTIYVYMDGVAREDLAIPLTDTMANTTITLDVRGVNQLRLYRHGGSRYYYGIGDIQGKLSTSEGGAA